MALFCVPKQFIETLTTSALKTQVDLEKLYLMSSKERRDFFSSYTNKETGKFLNAKFEQAMVSQQKTAMLDWAKSVFTPTEKKKPVFKTVLDKIEQLSEMGYLNEKAEDVFLEDLISDKLGVTISAAEMETITDKAKKVEEAQRELGNNIGNPDFTDENIAFFKALKDINDYMQSVTPASLSSIFVGTIGRGVKLLSIKSPILNIGSNFFLGGVEAVTRRISGGSVKGADNKLALGYIKLARDIYKETGYDISRMQSIRDSGAAGERVLGESVHSQGPGKVRVVGRVVEDIVFKQLMGAPDAAFASVHFADSVNLLAKQMSGGDTELSKELMLDAMRVDPVTPDGQLLREQAILDAQYATWTNNTWASELTLGFRKLVNNLNPDLRVGDYLFPFVKTPANVVANSLDYAGLGLFRGVVELVSMARTGRLGDKGMQREVIRNVSRSGLGFIAAMALASNLEDDDYVGAYDPYRYQLDQLRNAPQNSFRIGDTWVSTDWLGPISVPFNAIMYARKYGKAGPTETVAQYFKGAANSITNLPVVEDFYTIWDDTMKQDQTLDEMGAAFGESAIAQASGMLIPSIFSDVAKAFDTKERKTTNATEALLAKIPGARNTLPAKTNVLGEEMDSENPLSTILFGSRVKTSNDDAVISEVEEVVRLSGKNIQFTDWQKSGSKKLGQFRDKVGDARFKKATAEYGRELRLLIKSTMSESKYKNADALERNSMLSGLDAKAIDQVFKTYNFTYKQEKKKK